MDPGPEYDDVLLALNASLYTWKRYLAILMDMAEYDLKN